MEGVINVLKPSGMTSSDVVVRLRRILKTKKIGHTGTLDPQVTGVLPICVGKATRLAEYLTNQGKSYRAEITFGITTDTQDSFGNKLEIKDANISQEDFIKILPEFTGHIMQIPPMYSAVRHQGKHLYELARLGIEVERKARKAEIRRLDLLEWHPGEFPKAVFEVDCSKGTYIRTLCHDMGLVLGCGAHMSKLVRLSSGPFKIENSISLEDIEKKVNNKDFSFLIPVRKVLDLPYVYLTEQRARAFKNGLSSSKNSIKGIENLKDGTEVQVFNENIFLGIGIWRDNVLYPHKVF